MHLPSMELQSPAVPARAGVMIKTSACRFRCTLFPELELETTTLVVPRSAPASNFRICFIELRQHACRCALAREVSSYHLVLVRFMHCVDPLSLFGLNDVWSKLQS